MNGNARTARLDVGEPLEFINHELGRCDIYLADLEILKFLRELREVDLGGDGEDELLANLRESLTRDLETNRAQGLYCSRSRFLVYCYTAQHLRSRELARALLRFFTRKGDRIVDEEKTCLLTEWCLGLQQLEGLVPEDRWYKAFRQVARLGPPLFEEWRRPGPQQPWIGDILRLFQDRVLLPGARGRHQRHLIPNVRRYALPPLDLPRLGAIPPYPRTGYNTPVLAPVHDLQALQFRQHLQTLEMARLLSEVDELHRRGY